ncbi:hypothetical protein ACTSLC_24555, partial [Citrobacter freundii]
MSIKRYEANGSSSVFEDANGSLVDYEDYSALEQKLTDMAVQLANAESKCRGLAAENAGLNVFIEEECFVYSSDTPEPIDANDCKPETKVTDAFLAEVRAQGVEMMAAEADQLMNEFGDDSYKVMVTADLQRFANA